MARYKPSDTSPRLLPVDLEAQLVLGTFAQGPHHLVVLLDLSAFDAHYRNDEGRASKHAPAMLLKAMHLAYSQDIISSRAIERVCWDNVLFIALTGDANLRLWAAEHHRTSFDPDHVSAMPATAH